MDINPLDVVAKIWRHSGVNGGSGWVPHIYAIGQDNQKFREGPALDARKPVFPELRDSVDWYFTPAVSSTDSRRAKQYPAQRAVWVDCDESFNDKLLQELKPSFMWETSPGHKQAVWLIKESLRPSEFHRDGFIGMLTHALGSDKSGVDVGQLLRVPGTWHHKAQPFQGRMLRSTGTVYPRSVLLRLVARGLGFPAGLASELSADEPWGDRSKLLWKFARQAAELGIDQKLTFKLIKATKWNKWVDDPERLKDDIAKAYEHTPERPEKASQEPDEDEEEDEPTGPLEMAGVDSFGPVLRRPVSWVLPGIIPEAGCGLLVSAPKVGKTRISIEMALGLATGRRPLGIAMGKPLPVGFLSLEDGEYLFADRLNTSLNRDAGRFKYHWDGHITRDKNGAFIWEPPQPMSLLTNFAPIDLSDDREQHRLHETITAYGLKLMIIDTLSMAIGKADVSNSKDMYAILKAIKKIAKETKCAIMFIHHTRKRVFEKGESIQEMVLGSTALHAWSDFIMNLVSPEEDSELLRLGVQTKMGNHLHYLDTRLKIIKKPTEEEMQ